MKDIFERAFVTILWVVLIILAVQGKPIWLILLAGLHLCETVFAGMWIGLKYGKGLVTTLVCCMVWGYLWWLPLKKRMGYDELSDEDFIEDGLEPWREKQ